MIHIHIIQHESFVEPGAFLPWAEQREYAVHLTKCWEGETVPQSAEGINLLLVLGGPQCPATTKRECPYFDAQAERVLIRACISSGKIVVGTCLGAQLIGEALGAPYLRSPEREVGPMPITLTQAGKDDPLWNHLQDGDLVGEWHNDMPGLTPESEILAYSEGCPRQIVRYGRFVYGLQCHMEFTRDVHAKLIEHMGDSLVKGEADCFVQSAEDIQAFDCTAMNQKLFDFLDALVSLWEQEHSV